jgi:enoyl-CoA hydratase
MTPTFETLELQIDQHVATVSLNRPDRANAMNAPLWAELQTCFEWLDEEPSVRAIILAGNGKNFCAGLDLAMFGSITGSHSEPSRKAEALRRTIMRLQGNLSAIENCRKPVLAAIHKACVGGGIDMTCCADMRYASKDAYFSIKEIDIGMVADVGTLQRLPTIIPDAIVRELAYTGRNMSADEAKEVGFLNRVFEDRDTLMREVTAIAREIASKSPLAIRGTKEMLLYSRDHSVSDGLNYIATWNAGMLSEADLGLAMQAQLEQKPAIFED